MALLPRSPCQVIQILELSTLTIGQTASMSCLSVDERVADFTAKEIDVMFPEVVRHLNTPSTSTQVSGNKQCESAPAHRRQQKHRHNNRRNNHPQRKGQNTGASARPHLVQVAA